MGLAADSLNLKDSTTAVLSTSKDSSPYSRLEPPSTQSAAGQHIWQPGSSLGVSGVTLQRAYDGYNSSSPSSRPAPSPPLAPRPIPSMMDTADLKIIMLGDSAVGKSKILERYLLEEYCPRTQSTHALTLFRHNYMDESGKDYKIDFWDTAGQEQFNKLHPSYYFQANACVLAFDVTRKVTYKNLETWYKEMRIYCPDIPVICIANKVDADLSMVEKKFSFSSKHKLPFFFVSAADGTNVVRVVQEAIKLAIKNKEEPTDEVMAEIWALLQEEDGGCSKSESYDDWSPCKPVLAAVPFSVM